MKCEQCGKEIRKTNAFTVNYNGKSTLLCGKHYQQYLKFGHCLDSEQRTCFDRNDYEITEEGVWIYTFNRKQEPSGKFLIDLEDLEKVIIYKWRCWKGNYYTGNFKPIPIYKFLIDTPEGMVIDHINGNRADNRKSNLRICSQQKNVCNSAKPTTNTSGFTGVWWDNLRNKWCVEIKFNYIKCYLGRYELLADAVFARYYAETQVFKEYRNNREDEKIFAIINDCNCKDKIKAYVDKRISEKFNL